MKIFGKKIHILRFVSLMEKTVLIIDVGPQMLENINDGSRIQISHLLQ